VRAATVQLTAPLSAEDCALQSMPDASPVKWHLAHSSWFFETFLLVPSLEGYRPFADDFRVLFNSYYQTVGRMHERPQRGLLTRPTVEEVVRYRAQQSLTAVHRGPRSVDTLFVSLPELRSVCSSIGFTENRSITRTAMPSEAS